MTSANQPEEHDTLKTAKAGTKSWRLWMMLFMVCVVDVGIYVFIIRPTVQQKTGYDERMAFRVAGWLTSTQLFSISHISASFAF
jgi:hypothetical protein